MGGWHNAVHFLNKIYWRVVRRVSFKFRFSTSSPSSSLGPLNETGDHSTRWSPFYLMKTNRTARLTGYIAHIGSSRSAGYWAIVKSGNREYFAYGRSFLSHPNVPRIGQRCAFTPLPPGPSGKLRRGTEVAIQKPGGKLQAQHSAGVVRLVLHERNRQRLIGRLDLAVN